MDVGKELGKEDRQWLEAVELAMKCTRCRETDRRPREDSGDTGRESSSNTSSALKSNIFRKEDMY